jgi:hypothetical protein
MRVRAAALPPKTLIARADFCVNRVPQSANAEAG